MKSRWTRTGIFLLILSIGNLTPALFFGRAAPGKKPLTHDVYDS